MVTITGYFLRINQEGKEFYALVLQGGIEYLWTALSGITLSSIMNLRWSLFEKEK